MSELINNREYRQGELKKIITDLHDGKPVEEVKARFKNLIKDIGPTEISQLEQALIREGLPEEEIKRLCDVHVSIFRDALDVQTLPEQVPGHPVHTFRQENDALSKVVDSLREIGEELKTLGQDKRQDLVRQFKGKFEALRQVEKHYSRKENILFPYLEKNGITGPPSVMWSIHDDIRDQLKEIARWLTGAENLSDDELRAGIDGLVEPALKAISEMIYKENNILLPMSLETLTEDEWLEVAEQSPEIGFTLIEPGRRWHPYRDPDVEKTREEAEIPSKHLKFDSGVLKLEEVELILNHLPVDVSFVDKDNIVRYFSQGKERIFARTKAIIGRKVEKCHPPESVHVVTRIIEDFRTGKRDTADFWINLEGRLIYIRYFAVRDENGDYVGVLEVTQDVTTIRTLEGEKRLLDPM